MADPMPESDGCAKESRGTLGQIFDPFAETEVYSHSRPHWCQSGVVVFITMRTHDSIPKEVIRRWDREKQEWVRRRGYSGKDHWTKVIPTLPSEDQFQFAKQFNRCREEFLDTCHGACRLRNPSLAAIVEKSLLHFDGERYELGDFVIMPNHVHLLASFPSCEDMKNSCDSWMHFTARKINIACGTRGKFWQQEPFDTLVRSPEQYDYLRQYIRDNPIKAKLRNGEYLHRELH
ncbi:MAG: transposase [Pirellulales bacterium]